MSQPTPPASPHRRRDGGAIALVVTGALLLALALFLPAGAETEGPPDGVGPTGEIGTENPGAAAIVGPGTTVSVANTPYSSEGMTCDESRDGWHFIMNGIETTGGGDPAAADFGPITLQFSDGSSGLATFTDASSKTAHFLDATNNQSGLFTLTSASMTFPAGTTVTSFTNFVISHPPCGTVTTSTNPVSTETSSTTSPVSTATTPTSGANGDGSVPSSGVDDSAAVVAAAGTAQPADAVPAGSALPSTGIDGRPFVIAGLLLAASGSALWIMSRRRAVD